VSNSNFERLVNKYYSAAYQYAEHFLMDNHAWQDSTESKIIDLYTTYVFVRRAMLKYDLSTMKPDLAIPDSLSDFILPDHVGTFSTLLEKQNECTLYSITVQLAEIDRWINHLEYSEDTIRYLQSDPLHKTLFKIFTDIDKVIVLMHIDSDTIRVESTKEIFSQYRELFQLVSRKIKRKRSELCIPRDEVYNYWFSFEQQEVQDVIDRLLRSN
jgi:hypothetical protein